MPCDQIRTISVDLSQAVKVGKEHVLAAVIAMYGDAEQNGNRIEWDYGRQWIDTATGQSRVTSSEVADAIKVGISKSVVMVQAKKFGWNVRVQPDGKLVVQKGAF